MNDGFIRQIERTLRPGGQLHFWTDVEDYFTEAIERIAAITSLQGPIPVAQREPEHDLDYLTHFERRKRIDGKEIFRSEFRKREE